MAVSQHVQSVKIKKECQSIIPCLSKLSFKNKVGIGIFPGKRKLRNFVIIKPAMQEIFKEVSEFEIKRH